ncbi:beta-ketoacyl synthase N-terminal-like domain-containing protein [Neolewinella agarilytica]|uniref:3-oxoacyl-[acyl-carrier-protein] synthase-1 n=1 Tax=Neolewinella agarilytica TaxID=478744 RepID=A0A1H9AIN3_9BACT|nr:beta-ketoacyl synthase N-terminal-like domain-containing protein [Neolewinella agarilytica]SEP76606.1 3-oxoacyl-[acyl-carrier-protein] synthase-1 [Neolewinella agarilytica]
MKKAAVITGHGLVSSFGDSTEANWQSLLAGYIGLRKEKVAGGYACPVGRIFQEGIFSDPEFVDLTRSTLKSPPMGWDWTRSATSWILCSAKGNITGLGHKGAYSLADSAKSIADDLKLINTPTCISTACTSSLAGIVLAVRMMKSGQYTHVAVTGCDLASDFVLNGFNRINAVSPEICRPYDADRKGINLATAAATIFLEWRSPKPGEIYLTGEATSNDGFHISRPKPDGAGLSDCIRRSCGTEIPDFICGHGTATLLNDNMESEAIARSGMATIPLFSIKGQIGHTLGACGVLETVVTAKCLQEDTILSSCGFKKPGTSAIINVSRKVQKRPLRSALNLSVGFGGGNAAIHLTKA